MPTMPNQAPTDTFASEYLEALMNPARPSATDERLRRALRALRSVPRNAVAIRVSLTADAKPPRP